MSNRNRTYERALSAFFNNSDLTEEQKERLPSEVDGLSVRRKKQISAVLDAGPCVKHRGDLFFTPN